MNYLGDYAEDSNVKIYFTTHSKEGGAIAPSDAFENSDIFIYKDGSVTPKATANGIVMSSPFDTLVGLHLLEIDTANDTGDVGFWAAGSEYSVILSPDTETVDAETIIKVIGSFSIERAGASISMLKNGSYGLVKLESIVSGNETDLTTLLSRLVGTILAGNHSAQSGDAYAIVNNGTYGNSALETLVDDLETRIGTPSNLGSGATVAANLVDIEGQTDDIGVAGAGLTNINLPDQTINITGDITGNLSGSVGSVTGGVTLDTAAIDAILDDPVEGAITLRQAMRVLLAYLAGHASGGGTANPKFRDQANTKDRISMTVDASGNRSVVTLDLT